jgi:hypothetical protein
VVNTGERSVTLRIALNDSLEYWASDRSGNVEAHKTIGPVIPPSLKLTATPLAVTYPTIVTLAAVYSSTETTEATFEVRYESDPKWYSIGSVVSSGRFVLLQIPPKRAYYRVRVGTLESTPTANALVSAGIAKPRASSAKIRVGTSARFWGTIRPKHPAGAPAADTRYRVRFWKYNTVTKRWIETTSVYWKIDQVLDNDTSAWSYPRTFRTSEAGLWRVAFYHACPRHAAKTSPVLQFSVVK